MVTWFTSDRTVSFSIQSATSIDFIQLAARAATAVWLSVQIVICLCTLRKNFCKFWMKISEIFFLRGGSPSGSGSQAHWPIALSLLFKFLGGYLGVKPPFRGFRSCSVSPLLFVPGPSWQSPRFASLPFP